MAWIIEHVKPLREALGWLAGNHAQIEMHAQTWRNVAGRFTTALPTSAGLCGGT